MAKKSPGVASDSLCMLVVCNTASIQLIPTTVATVRAAEGCASPFDILPAGVAGFRPVCECGDSDVQNLGKALARVSLAYSGRRLFFPLELYSNLFPSGRSSGLCSSFST